MTVLQFHGLMPTEDYVSVSKDTVYHKNVGFKARIHCEMFLLGHFMKYVFHDSFIV